jgi:uncharacterized surface protein with fasciclin (FAS1) repeats
MLHQLLNRKETAMIATRTKLLVSLLTSASLVLPLTAFAGASEIVNAQQMEQAAATQPGSVTQATDLVQAAKSAGSFKTWLTAIDKAGLTDMLKGGEYTVFAPTDEAFSKLPPGKLDALMKDPAQLQQVLKHHIVADKLKVGDVPIGKMRSLSGEALDFEANRRHKLAIEGAFVVVPDLVANNGVMHGIDRVIVKN